MTAHEQHIELTINGEPHAIFVAPGMRLSDALRDHAGLKSVKSGCDAGDCGACTVLIDGAQNCACLIPAIQAGGKDIETLERSEPGLRGRLQDAFLAHGAAQCGICTPGIMMAAMDLLRNVPRPTEAEVETALGGVLCRCTRIPQNRLCRDGGQSGESARDNAGQLGRQLGHA